jgi:hypothetical protein
MRDERNEIVLLEFVAKIYNLFKRNTHIILAFVIPGIVIGILQDIITQLAKFTLIGLILGIIIVFFITLYSIFEGYPIKKEPNAL